MKCYKEIFECRVCKNKDLIDIIDLGCHALSGYFPKNNEILPQKAPLTLVRCSECSLVQLKHSVIPEVMFTQDYGYRSSINQTMRTHLKDLVASIDDIITLKSEDIVLDIGCNDGTLLKAYDEKVRKFGIDPIADKFRDSYPNNMQIMNDFFSKDAFDKFGLGTNKAKVITSISMFYDLEDPVQFAKNIASCLDADGVWVLEQSYLVHMLANNSFDTICHEHLEYYSLKQIEHILFQAQLKVVHLSFNDINGGSMRVYATHINSSIRSNEDIIQSVRESEVALKLSENAIYQEFKNNCEGISSSIKNFLEKEYLQNKIIHVYGASTKGNTILQYCSINYPLIQAAADRNPEKWGCFTPSTNIPIISEEESRNMKPDYYLVLPWHFREEFISREKEYNGKLIFPLPYKDASHFLKSLEE